MKIALVGVTGRVGSRLATELLSRGHAVTGIALHASGNARTDLKIVQTDATKPESLAPCLVGHDAVISASRFVTSNADALLAAVKSAHVKRRLVVGDAGSLEVAPGKRTGHFRIGGDQLLNDANGESHISMEDFATAMVDEVERPTHNRKPFTAGY